MKAAVYERSGPAAEVLRVTDVPRPEPGAGEVRVRIQASGVNPTDWKSRAGATPRPIDEFQVPNQDGAGVIDAVGDGVDPGRMGQRVWVWMAAAGRRWGTAAGPGVIFVHEELVNKASRRASIDCCRIAGRHRPLLAAAQQSLVRTFELVRFSPYWLSHFG